MINYKCKKSMNTHTKIGVLAGLLLAIGAEQALAQMPGMPYMPYVKPATITLTQNQKYMLASIYDADYLPYTAPTAAATTTRPVPAGGTSPVTIDVQGSIPTTGVTVYIPATATGCLGSTIWGAPPLTSTTLFMYP
jgi:hypothetical protein